MSSITPGPIGVDADGTPQYAQAYVTLPDGGVGLVVASTPPEVDLGGGDPPGVDPFGAEAADPAAGQEPEAG